MSEELEAPKKKSKLPLIIIIVLLLLILGGGAGAAWYFLFSGKNAPADGAVKEVKIEEKGSGQQGPTGFSTDLPSFLVNLSDPLGKRFIKLNISLEMTSAEAIQEVSANMPRIRDAVIMLLSSKTFSDLSTLEGKMLLKNEILGRINQVLGGSKVATLSFTDFIIQ